MKLGLSWIPILPLIPRGEGEGSPPTSSPIPPTCPLSNVEERKSAPCLSLASPPGCGSSAAPAPLAAARFDLSGECIAVFPLPNLSSLVLPPESSSSSIPPGLPGLPCSRLIPRPGLPRSPPPLRPPIGESVRPPSSPIQGAPPCPLICVDERNSSTPPPELSSQSSSSTPSRPPTPLPGVSPHGVLPVSSPP